MATTTRQPTQATLMTTATGPGGAASTVWVIRSRTWAATATRATRPRTTRTPTTVRATIRMVAATVDTVAATVGTVAATVVTARATTPTGTTLRSLRCTTATTV